jgi:hypothetical protein
VNSGQCLGQAGQCPAVSDKIRLELSSGICLNLARPDNVHLGQTKSGETGESPTGAFGLGVLNRVGIFSNLHFHFILHTPLNSMVYLDS